MPADLPSPLLRNWLNAGLETLLLDDEARVEALRRHAGLASGEKAARQAAPGKAQASQSPRPSAGKAPGTPRKNATPAPGEPAPPRRRTGNAAPLPSDIWPPDAWPPAWVALRERRPLPPRPLVVWTYPGLGDDLMGTPDAGRQQIIVRMLTSLKHAGGTHVFWPYALPGEPLPEPGAPSLFWSGVALLKPRALLLFGSEARDALAMPKSLVPYCQERVDGRLVIQLPQPASLADSEAFGSALAFLSGLLSFCRGQ